MPVMCTVQLPIGKSRQQIKNVMEQISNVLMNEFEMQPNQVRVTITELPLHRYIAGGVLAEDMPGFNCENGTD